MADITPNVDNRISPDEGQIVKITWNELVENNNVGVAVKFPVHADRSVQMVGTFDGATVVLEGSNDGENYVTLTNAAGSSLSFTAAGLKQVVEAPLYVRPNVTAANANTAIDCHLLLRRNVQLTR